MIGRTAMKLRHETRRIETPAGEMKVIVLRPEGAQGPVPGILWIHGGGYMLGMAEMVYVSCGRMLAARYGAVVVSPEYRLAQEAPYPAAAEDCYAALVWMWEHAGELGVDRERLVVGGESAGGGLAVSVCLRARDEGVVPVAMQIPLYPMIDCEDTESSADNHGYVWNTRRNHWGWRHYLGELYGTDRVPAYASPARERDVAGLPPAFTFVCEGEPFYSETLEYVRKLQAAGVPAQVQVWPGKTHAFDLLMPWTGKARGAREGICRAYEREIVTKPGHF
ncbi:MAG: alpha/beta hydrolase [Lachnospiraceae bacterium]|nr:alpha/beta hydrolase [Lachnospiraceae bacterium]